MESKNAPENQKATPLAAFSEAVAIAYAANINEHLKENPVTSPRFFKTRALNKAIHEASKGTCERSSIDAAYVLATRFPETYKKMFLMTSYDLPQSSNVSRMIVGRQGTLFYHTYVVMESVDGIWYAASPGNHNTSKSDYYALKIIAEPTLEKVINYITHRDGGSWPDPYAVERSLNGPEYQSPIADKNDKGLTIFNTEQGNSIKKFMFTYSSRVNG